MEPMHGIIASAFEELVAGRVDGARTALRRDWPFEAPHNPGRHQGHAERVRIFLRDGFLDRYSGERLVFPPVLRLLSEALPDVFPFHPHWKMAECHIAHWKLHPTIDHIVPVARGGRDDDPANKVCTSQLRNSTKANWLLEELGWSLHPPGDLNEWDGLVGVFMRHVEANPAALRIGDVGAWHRAVRKVAPGLAG